MLFEIDRGLRSIAVCVLLCYDNIQATSISTCGRAFTKDWIISMARAIVGNRATSGSDQRPMYDQS